MMPSHDLGVQGRELCSDRHSICDCSRRAAPRYLVDSSPRLTRSTAHRTIACGVSCHSPRRISCGASLCEEHHVRGSSDSKTQIRGSIFSSSQIVLGCRITVPRSGVLQTLQLGRAKSVLHRRKPHLKWQRLRRWCSVAKTDQRSHRANLADSIR